MPSLNATQTIAYTSLCTCGPPLSHDCVADYGFVDASIIEDLTSPGGSALPAWRSFERSIAMPRFSACAWPSFSLPLAQQHTVKQTEAKSL